MLPLLPSVSSHFINFHLVNSHFLNSHLVMIINVDKVIKWEVDKVIKWEVDKWEFTVLELMGIKLSC